MAESQLTLFRQLRIDIAGIEPIIVFQRHTRELHPKGSLNKVHEFIYGQFSRQALLPNV